MLPKLNVYAVPSLADPKELEIGTVVVIDILRATTTIVHAIAAGATAVVPCASVEDAQRLAEILHETDDTTSVLLAGERECLPIPGFDLGNSPSEYRPEVVFRAVIILTTTNGTQAFQVCRRAQRVLVGAFVNASAVLKALFEESHAVHLLCSGIEGEFTRDDTLFAGMLVDHLERKSGLRYELNAQAITARENWRAAFAPPYSSGAEPIPPEMLAAQLRNSAAGEKLIAAGMESDIYDAARIDLFTCLPTFDPTSGIIVG
ncbi:MAG TPA: 2-phosphosulfolactate phosphatase [Thermogutta sp.]|nr:2-phosphosulfolactate phosphatase [Thermogutta sp.]